MSNGSNPCGLDGIEFVEYTGPNRNDLAKLFAAFGFEKIADHKEKSIELFRQGDINFLLNSEKNTFSGEFQSQHGPSICSMGFRCKDKAEAFKTAVERGARPFESGPAKTFLTDYPAMFGIGDSLIYFIDEYGSRGDIYDKEFNYTSEKRKVEGKGFLRVDHLTNNVPKGEMQKWCDFYTNIFGFYEDRFFDIKGEKTGLISKVMKSQDQKIIIPINEPTDEKSQIQEYLDEYHGSGIQHLALLCSDIINSVAKVRESGVSFLDVPDTYYEALPDRLSNIEEPMESLQKLKILADGDDEGYLLQIFTQNIIGPIFFEVIERKNHDGFGEGNFQALFDAIERDQERRGVL